MYMVYNNYSSIFVIRDIDYSFGSVIIICKYWFSDCMYIKLINLEKNYDLMYLVSILYLKYGLKFYFYFKVFMSVMV